MNNSFMDRPQNLNSNSLLHDNPALTLSGQLYHLGNGERLLGSNSGTALPEEPTFLSGMIHTSHVLVDMEAYMTMRWGVYNSTYEELSNDRVVLSKGLDNSLHKCPPVSRAVSSLDVLSDMASASHNKHKNPTSIATSDERRNECVENVAAAWGVDTQACGKKEARFRRSSSYNDAAGITTETSFIDVLKKPVFSEADAANAAALESSDGSLTARNGKKKGKKGRQIDPALLGFKVSSNRIMMGEIQHLDDI
ncbi:hypothetical protein OIU78_025954 [Salix suchowensis]|nr:hypothetical protein OIU78_025954 [Salix suchowensis]